VAATLVDPTGKENTDGITIQGNTVSISETAHKYRRAAIRSSLRSKTGKDETVEDQQFDWGVLTVNVNKSIYHANDTAQNRFGRS